MKLEKTLYYNYKKLLLKKNDWRIDFKAKNWNEDLP